MSKENSEQSLEQILREEIEMAERDANNRGAQLDYLQTKYEAVKFRLEILRTVKTALAESQF